MSSNRLKSNGARLSRLIIDQGTETMRKYFDSIHSPSHLTTILYSCYSTLRGIRVINATQMQKLFPPSGMLPAMASTSKDYDITLLFILIRNICGLSPPASTRSWDILPPLADVSKAADVVRIKYYRNKVYGHIVTTGVEDTEFDTYWKEISDALVRLGANLGDIAMMKASPLDEDLWITLLNEWYEKDHKNEVLGTKTFKKTETIEEIVKKNRRNINCIMLSLCVVFFVLVVFGVFVASQFWKVPDYSYRQNISNPDFVGREWVIRQIELDFFNKRDLRVVQLVTDLGWGKSAIVKHLISSPLSSAIIHENIIGHHFCKYNVKSTRDGERFVKKFVQQISKNIQKFGEIVQNDRLIGEELQSSCEDNPVKCFQTAVVEPLLKLSTDRNNSFFLIDAIDECLGEEERNKLIIVKILSKNLPKLPTWVKVIITSRNQTQAISKISKIKGSSTLKLDADDPRNLRDLRTYAEQKLQALYIEVPSTKEKLPLNDSIEIALKFSKGSFLSLKSIISYWQEYPNKMDEQSIPESLENIYETSFAERFQASDFGRFKPLLEVLLAANSPPTLLELRKILNCHDKNYQTRTIALKLSEFFMYDIDQGPLEFRHQFFAEWLIKQTDNSNGIVIEKSRGHQHLVEYLFHFYSERRTNFTYKELSELCTHILHGDKMSVSNTRKLRSFSVSKVRDSSKRCILHDLSPKSDAKELIDELINQFDSVDILDDGDWTPAMHAVQAGSYENLELFIDHGANVNHAAKRTFCFFWDFMVLRSSYETNSSMSFLAAYRGYTKIAKLLARKNAKIDKADECGWKPLYPAAVMGHFDIVQLYVNRGAQADAISLHHAAARNHSAIVQFLLNTGLRDKCLPCKPGNISWCRVNIHRFHNCFCETALYAAVARNNLQMAKLILEKDNGSVNCKHGSGRTPLMEGFSHKNIQMVTLLVSAGANIEAECESTTSDLFHYCSFMAYKENKWLYSRYCNQPVCYKGDRVIHFALAHGVWKITTKFISKGKFNAPHNTSAVTVAAIYDQVDFINSTYGTRIKSIPNIEAALRYMAICHSVGSLKYLLSRNDLSKFTAVYEDGKTLLHFATLGSSKRKIEAFVTQSCASSVCHCPNKAHGDIVDKKRLETVMLLTKVLASEINKRDKYGRTALHYAAAHISSKLVEYLVNAGADWKIKDQRGDTALEFALRERPLDTETFLPCQLTSDKVFRVCSSTLFDELTSYLLQKATIKKCDIRAKNLMGRLLFHRLPLSLYVLFKSGLDVNCAREQFTRYLNGTSVSVHWSKRHDELLEIFKIYEIDVHEVCDVPFAQSELHLMAYLGTSSLQVGNLFQPSVNESSFPFQRLISTHPKGVEILNECYDKEGYLTIHRAVQGTNLNAVSWFIEVGVDIFRKTKSGMTALALATYSYPSSSTFSLLDDHRKSIFEKLVEKNDGESHTSFHCNIELVDLSPLHVAGSRGMGMLDAFRRKIPEFPLVCANSDGIQPIYLAYLYHATNGYISWNDKQAFQDLGLSLETGPSKYPKREAEYHLIYNQFYRTPPDDLRNVLSHEFPFDCPGINELLPHKTGIKDYERLQSCTSRCWPSAFEASREFSLHFPYLDIQNIISNPFTDKFVDIEHHMAELRFHLVKMTHFNSFQFISISNREKILWRKVKKAHSCACKCSCFEIMRLLQETFTSEPRKYKMVGKFVAERMGWTDSSSDGDVLYRWPFSFLLKKALRSDKAYKYLEILSPQF